MHTNSPYSSQIQNQDIDVQLRLLAQRSAKLALGISDRRSFIYVWSVEFVLAALRKLLSMDSVKATQTEIGFLTGIGPEEIRTILNRPASDTVHFHTTSSRIIHLWRTQEKYLDPITKKPATLPLRGAKGTFQGLINEVVRGVTAFTAMRHLKEMGIVHTSDDKTVALKDSRIDGVPLNR